MPEAQQYLKTFLRGNEIEHYVNLIKEAKEAVSIPVIGRDAAEAFFNVCLSECTYKGPFYKLYEELANGAEADFSRSSFMGDTEAKFAFVKGLKILND